MSQAVRNRKNRREDTGGSYTESLYGAMIRVKTYSGEVRMFDVHAAAPTTAGVAGRMDDELLRTDD